MQICPPKPPVQTGKKTEHGVALAMSGGGFRATLFHLGVLIRLNELGFLPQLKEITSVSGGSILAGHLALNWNDLHFNSNIAANFNAVIEMPIRKFCSSTIDMPSGLKGIFNPFKSGADYLVDAYDEWYGGKSIQAIPSGANIPRFTFYATGLQTGVSVRIAKDYLADYRVGKVPAPQISVAQAVAASSAFPPVFCPVSIKFNPKLWEPLQGADLSNDNTIKSELLLGDGGIYDNMALERIWKRFSTVLVSDAGAPFETFSSSFLVSHEWLSRLKRTLEIFQQQVGAVRKRWLIENFIDKKCGGTYWGIATNICDYELEPHNLGRPMTCDNQTTRALKDIRTRLNAFSQQEQGQLINWGYALTDAAMRRHVLSTPPAQGNWPDKQYPL